jgi:hypothetical protein
MSTIDARPSNNGTSSEPWRGAWTHLRIELRELAAPPSQSVRYRRPGYVRVKPRTVTGATHQPSATSSEHRNSIRPAAGWTAPRSVDTLLVDVGDSR